jgi:L,D-peptidoglycan transpeptidase YkuD (ErfK/YbiS/YcfS/YnhG family)
VRLARGLAAGSAVAALLTVGVAGAGSAAAVAAAVTSPASAGAHAATHHRTVVGPRHIRGLHHARRVMIVTAATTSSTHALVRRYHRDSDGRFRRVGRVAHARIGLAGLSHPKQRHSGDGTTPMGVYGFVFGFGSRADPGMTGLNWRRLTPGTCWAGTRAHYNRWVHRSPCASGDEDLWSSEATAYTYAAVIDFNYHHPVYGRGSGIFLHHRLPAATHGCVSLHPTALLRTLRWLRPNSKIVIGTPSSLRALRR